MFSHENNNVRRCKMDGHNQRNPDVVYSQNITGQKNKRLIQFLSAALLVQSETRSPESGLHGRETEHSGRHAAQHADVPVTFPVLNHTTHNILLGHTKRREAPAGGTMKSCTAATSASYTGGPSCCWTESIRVPF